MIFGQGQAKMNSTCIVFYMILQRDSWKTWIMDHCSALNFRMNNGSLHTAIFRPYIFLPLVRPLLKGWMGGPVIPERFLEEETNTEQLHHRTSAIRNRT